MWGRKLGEEGKQSERREERDRERDKAERKEVGGRKKKKIN